MMKWKIDMTEEDQARLLAEAEELDAAYASMIEQIELQRDAEELETEHDLYRYWQP